MTGIFKNTQKNSCKILKKQKNAFPKKKSGKIGKKMMANPKKIADKF